MKQITVSTNDLNHPSVELIIRADIVNTLALEQTTVTFRQVNKGQQEVRYATLVGKDADQTDITAITCAHPSLRVEYSKTGFDNIAHQRIRITLPADTPIGRFSEQVILKTNHPKKPTLTMLVVGEVVGIVRAVPYRLNFSLTGVPSDVVRQVRFNSINTPFKILGVTCDVPGLKTRLEEVAPGTAYTVTVTLPAGYTGGPFAGTLVIETDLPDQKTVEVKVVGQPRRTPNPELP